LTPEKKFEALINEISGLEKLHWKNPGHQVWIHKVLRFLKTEFGEILIIIKISMMYPIRLSLLVSAHMIGFSNHDT